MLRLKRVRVISVLAECVEKRGRGAGKKTPVVGMLKRNRQVYTQIVKACPISELLPMGFKRYEEDGILVLGYL